MLHITTLCIVQYKYTNKVLKGKYLPQKVISQSIWTSFELDAVDNLNVWV